MKLSVLSISSKQDKKGQLSLTNPRDACETFARLCKSSMVVSCIASFPIDSLRMVSYYRPVVTLCLKCTVFAQYRRVSDRQTDTSLSQRPR